MPGTDFSNLTVKRKMVANFKTAQFRQTNGEVLVDSAFFVATRGYKVMGARLVQAVAGTDAGAVTLMLEKCAAGQAPGAGTNLLATAWDLKATANTSQNGALVASATALTLNAGDRLSLNLTGTPTAVAGVLVEVDLQVMQQA
jgi:hypothetical protein